MPVFRTLVTPCDVIRDKSGIKKRAPGPVFRALSDEHKKRVGQFFSPEKLFFFIIFKIIVSDIILPGMEINSGHPKKLNRSRAVRPTLVVAFQRPQYARI